MKCNTFTKLLLWLVLGIFPLQVMAADNTIKNIVFFGDSLSDNGNLYSLSIGTYPKSPPYYKGRFSDGPTWAEKVGDFFKNSEQIYSSNYALGGESVLPRDHGKGYFAFTLDQSIEAYFLHVFSRSTRSETLYVLLIGANDYLWGSENPDQDTTDVNAGIKASVKSLIDAGGKNFLMLNLPDLSVVPAARGSDIHMLQELSRLHNEKLAVIVDELNKENPGVTVKIFDYNGLTKEILTDPDASNKKYNTHITNIQDPCYTGGYGLVADLHQETKLVAAMEQNYKDKTRYVQGHALYEKINFTQLAHQIITNPMLASTYYLGENSLSGGIQPCSHPESYLFWDYEHPTAQGHAITADMVIAYIQKNFGL